MNQEVEELQLKYRNKWRKESQSYWICRLVEEVGELAASLVLDHEHSPDHELKQIASICLNWLEYREKL